MPYELYDLYEGNLTVKCPYCGSEVPALWLVKALTMPFVALYLAGLFRPCTIRATKKKVECGSYTKTIAIKAEIAVTLDPATGITGDIKSLVARKLGWFGWLR